MKLPLLVSRSNCGASIQRAGGFTLPELLISITIFAFLITGVISAHLYGLSMFRVTETKLKATDSVRKTIGRMANEIRTCNTAWVGNIQTNGLFVGLLNGQIQQGSGILIQPTTDTNNYIVYYVDPSNKTFRRTTSAGGGAVILAETVTNRMVFRAQDHLGNVMTNRQEKGVIHIALEFFQPKRFRQVADYYKLETSVTQRSSE